MEKLSDSQTVETGGVLSSYQFLTLYFPAFILALGYSIATPAIPIFAKSFDTGFGVASLVIVVHAFGGLIAAVPTGFLVDHVGRRPMLFAGPMLMAASSCLTAVAQSFPELLCYRFLGGAAMEMWRQARLAIIADVSKSRQRGRQMSGMVGTEGRAGCSDRRLAACLEHGASACRLLFTERWRFSRSSRASFWFASQRRSKTNNRLRTKRISSTRGRCWQ
jgi:hypothetical protein